MGLEEDEKIMDGRSRNAPIQEDKALRAQSANSGFTIVEIIVVVVIIAIAAMLVVPMVSSAGSMQIQSAVNMIAADLEYAKSISISSQQNHSIVFDTAGDSYEIHDSGGTVIQHPVKKGFDYIVSFGANSRLNKVDIATASFDGTNEIEFDYLGSPYNGSGNALNSGVITVQAGSASLTVNVEGVTGFISITE